MEKTDNEMDVCYKILEQYKTHYSKLIQSKLTETLVHKMNCSFHCFTLALFIHIIIQGFFIVDAAVTPVRLFPAPQGRTIIPDLARPFPNILESDFSW